MSRPGTGIRVRPSSRSGLVSQAGPIPVTSRQSRMGTSMRTAGAVGVALSTEVEVENRPVTREGMYGMGTKGAKGQRQVQDKSYYLALLNAKITELENEKNRHIVEKEKLLNDSTESEVLQNKKNNIKKILEELRLEFKDMNLAVELLQEYSNDDALEQVTKKKTKLEKKNSKLSEKVNIIFKERNDKEAEIRELEEQISKISEGLESQTNMDLQERIPIKERVQQDREEVQRIQKQLQALKTELEGKKSEIKDLISELEAYKGDRSKNYEQLKEKYQILENFMSSYHTEKKNLMDIMNDHQQMIVQLLEHIGKNMSDKENFPSQDKFKEMKDDLDYKKEQKDISQTTLQRLNQDLQERRKELDKVHNLGEKIESDFKKIRQRHQEMLEELIVYKDIESMKETEKKEILELKKKREELLVLKESMDRRKSDLSKQNELLKRKLVRDEVYSELSDLDIKVRVYEQNNFALADYIRQRGAESDYTEHKKKALELVETLNQKVIATTNINNSLY
jgi:intraflagellar transport protein 74